MTDPDVITEARAIDDLGLHVDMLDVDRLQRWASHIDTYGADLSKWADPQFIVKWLQEFAERLEHTVKDEGLLRSRLATVAAHCAAQEAQIATKDDQYQSLLSNAYQLEATIRLLRIEQRADVKRWNAAITEAEAQIAALRQEIGK